MWVMLNPILGLDIFLDTRWDAAFAAACGAVAYSV